VYPVSPETVYIRDETLHSYIRMLLCVLLIYKTYLQAADVLLTFTSQSQKPYSR